MSGVAISEYGERYGFAVATVLFLIMLVYVSDVLWRTQQDQKESR